MNTSKLLQMLQGIVISAKLLYDSRKTYKKITFLTDLTKLRQCRHFYLSSTMIDYDEVVKGMPEECLKYISPLPPRKMMVVANLKMNGNKVRLEKYGDCLNKATVCLNEEDQKESRARMYKYQIYPDLVDIVIAPPYPYLESFSNVLRKDCEECRNCSECLDCTKCKDCECSNCKFCKDPDRDACCKYQCLDMENCDANELCQSKQAQCVEQSSCSCEDCGLCEFCQSCYDNNCADCSMCIQTAAQNSFAYITGGFSGEVSPRQIRETGGRWVIIGSSERRQLFGEGDELLIHKVRCALQARLKVVYCVSDETKDEYDTICEQLEAVFPKIGLDTGNDNDTGNPNKTKFRMNGNTTNFFFSVDGLQDWKNIVIVYEPLWAIKKGLVPTPEEAANKCKFIRDLIREQVSENVADNIRILYGGPVYSDTAQDYIEQPSIDGFYIGTTAFKITELIQIANAWYIKNRPDVEDLREIDLGIKQPCIQDYEKEEEEEE